MNRRMLLSTAAFGLGLAATGKVAFAQDKIKVGFVYVGPSMMVAGLNTTTRQRLRRHLHSATKSSSSSNKMSPKEPTQSAF